jgi:hypothetical protein
MLILNRCRHVIQQSTFIFARIGLVVSSFPTKKTVMILIFSRSENLFESADNLHVSWIWCLKGCRYTIWFQWQLRNGGRLLDQPWIAQLPSSSAFPFSKACLAFIDQPAWKFEIHSATTVIIFCQFKIFSLFSIFYRFECCRRFVLLIGVWRNQKMRGSFFVTYSRCTFLSQTRLLKNYPPYPTQPVNYTTVFYVRTHTLQELVSG